MPTYPGGKNGDGVYQTIINLMPPHMIYIELFLGSGAILRKKRPAPRCSIGVDSDAGAIANFDAEIPGLHLYCRDALGFLRDLPGDMDQPSTLIYLDPPYLMETRSSKRPLYHHEFNTIEQHLELLRAIRALDCMVMISGYYSFLYADYLHDWRAIQYQAQTRRGPVQEWLWMNYPEPIALHDYRYLGENFRERERIKRKQTRWARRLERMPALERYALLSAIEQYSCRTAENSEGTR